jgi:hypothetical protein
MIGGEMAAGGLKESTSDGDESKPLIYVLCVCVLWIGWLVDLLSRTFVAIDIHLSGLLSVLCLSCLRVL